MGTVQALRSHDRAPIGEAVTAFLATLDHPESRGTRRVYASTLRALRAEFGDDMDTAALEPRQVAAWFTRTVGAGRTRHVEPQPRCAPVSAAVLA